MKEILILHIILFLLAILSVHLMSWVGSVLHSVPHGVNNNYAVFTFRNDQKGPMSTNMLMNILFPNVFMIILHLACYHFEISYHSTTLFFYVPYYYLYRLILICVLLRRKELYNIGYEFTNIILGIVIAILLKNFLLVDPNKVFIPLSELVNEFWLIILVLIYKFTVLLLDRVFDVKNVIGEQRLERYICRQFDRFFKKYESITVIGEKEQVIWTLLYSIMIFEDYNRVPIVRMIERIKLLFKIETTIGIMQIKTRHNLSDKESIIEAYKKLRFDIIKDNLNADDGMQIKYYAFQYNPDEDYAKSVTFIYEHLKSYLYNHPKYSKKFFSNKPNIIKTNQNITSYLTIDDLTQMTGLSKEDIYKKIEQNQVSIFLSEKEATENFRIPPTDTQ